MAKVKSKTKLAFQAVSHCSAESARDNITNKISEFMPLNFVGRCDGIECDGPCYLRELGEN